jgi:hypothetical protein
MVQGIISSLFRRRLSQQSISWSLARVGGERTRASFLVYSGGGYPSKVFLGAWHELEERGAHCRRRFSSFGGPNLYRSS